MVDRWIGKWGEVYPKLGKTFNMCVLSEKIPFFVHLSGDDFQNSTLNTVRRERGFLCHLKTFDIICNTHVGGKHPFSPRY